jgi:glucokinase-like ROK family protein
MLINPEYALAIDIGGTFVKAGIISSKGKILVCERHETPARSEPETIVESILKLTTHLLCQSDLTISQIKGIGFSIAAFITADGLVTATAHLSQSWIGYDLKSRLEKELQTNLYFALDTPAPALGEAYFGAGKNYKHFIYMTVSTGIGAGIVHEGKIYTGGLGWAGGIGHTIIDENSPRICAGCKNHGCLETFSARQGIVQSALESMGNNPESLLAKLYRQSSFEISPKMVFEAAKLGDDVAINVFRQAGHALGIGLTNMVDIVSPERIVIGGGIAMAGDFLLEPARQVVRERAFPPQNRQVEIVQSELKDLSGMFGAASLVFYDLRINI